MHPDHICLRVARTARVVSAVRGYNPGDDHVDDDEVDALIYFRCLMEDPREKDRLTKLLKAKWIQNGYISQFIQQNLFFLSLLIGKLVPFCINHA